MKQISEGGGVHPQAGHRPPGPQARNIMCVNKTGTRIKLIDSPVWPGGWVRLSRLLLSQRTTAVAVCVPFRGY